MRFFSKDFVGVLFERFWEKKNIESNSNWKSVAMIEIERKWRKSKNQDEKKNVMEQKSIKKS